MGQISMVSPPQAASSLSWGGLRESSVAQGEHPGLGPILPLPLISCASWGSFLDLSEPQTPRACNGMQTLVVMKGALCTAERSDGVCFIYFLKLIYFEREWACVSGGGAEESIPSRLCHVSTEPEVGLEPTNGMMMT